MFAALPRQGVDAAVGAALIQMGDGMGWDESVSSTSSVDGS